MSLWDELIVNSRKNYYKRRAEDAGEEEKVKKPPKLCAGCSRYIIFRCACTNKAACYRLEKRRKKELET